MIYQLMGMGKRCTKCGKENALFCHDVVNGDAVLTCRFCGHKENRGGFYLGV